MAELEYKIRGGGQGNYDNLFREWAYNHWQNGTWGGPARQHGMSFADFFNKISGDQGARQEFEGSLANAEQIDPAVVAEEQRKQQMQGRLDEFLKYLDHYDPTKQPGYAQAEQRIRGDIDQGIRARGGGGGLADTSYAAGATQAIGNLQQQGNQWAQGMKAQALGMGLNDVRAAEGLRQQKNQLDYQAALQNWQSQNEAAQQRAQGLGGLIGAGVGAVGGAFLGGPQGAAMGLQYGSQIGGGIGGLAAGRSPMPRPRGGLGYF